MKALAYYQKHDLTQFGLREVELPVPVIGEQDLLVRVKAISTNPVDTKVRRNRDAKGDRPVVLGWDAAGVVEKVGAKVTTFKTGDEVWYAGDLNRDGSYAELQAIDSRLVARKPRNLDFVASAALPLTALTAWEALLERGFELGRGANVLVVGGAGGVGSIALQLLKAKTQATVIATASRPETVAWTKQLGADIVLDHRNDLREELSKNGIREVDVVLVTTKTKDYLPLLASIVRPFGHVVLIDEANGLDILPFKTKSISIHWEMMFAKSLNGYRLESQGEILAQVAALVEQSKVVTTAHTVLQGFTVDNLRRAHALQESGKAIGKIAIQF